MVIHQFYCTKCGTRNIPLPRKEDRLRPKGHLKRLYCPMCREVINHKEYREGEERE